MSHWKIGVKILCSKSWEGQNSMKAKIWGSKFYFFLVEPLVKILCSLKRGVKILYFFPVPWKRGVKTAEPTNQLHWRGAPPGLKRFPVHPFLLNVLVFLLPVSSSFFSSQYFEELDPNHECASEFCLPHWGRVMHICVSKLTIIGSDNWFGTWPKIT